MPEVPIGAVALFLFKSLFVVMMVKLFATITADVTVSIWRTVKRSKFEILRINREVKKHEARSE